ncbi:hypothetical protein LSH36_178g05055 [Paralvinella palmiformis]|uniref:BTB domain-containing protein n=1 Tax=Paralvinella palmiformis TaxID=53620 RepID=A0AAD9JRF2_9ANNE|nr:hypothetical protein LSH36_178g05055 [Paralvinella palmiformis]
MEKQIFTDSHAKSILTTMNNLRKSNTLCDVILRVGDKDFPVHRIVLAACSDYFCAMFTHGMSESDKTVIDLHEISANVMEVLLDFVYTETVNVSVENVQELLPAACLLQLTGVKQACSEFLEKQLDPSNCLGIRIFAENHGCESLQNAAESYTYKFFEDVIDNDEFRTLSITDVEKLISSDEIQVGSEEPVFEAVIHWVKHKDQERSEHLPCLLQYVRMPLLSAKYITDVIDDEPIVRQSLECRDLVDEAKKYHLRPDLRSQMQSIRTRPRTGCDDILVVVGGFGSQQSPIDIVEKYNPKTQEWHRLPIICRKRRYVASASVKNKVYVLGGYDGTARLSSVEVLDLSESEPQWRPVTPMIYRRGLAGVCAYQDMIYVCGGFDGSVRHTSMERYDPTIDEWSIMGNMTVGREGAGLVQANDMIYCIGGYDGVNLLNSVERYDLNTGNWSSVPAMTTRRSGAGIAVINDTIYVCGGYDGAAHLSSVECFNVRTSHWTTIAHMNIPRCYVGACVLKGKLYVVAGYDGSALLNTIECFDPNLETWEVMESTMSAQRCDAGVTVVRQR